ncbi:MAG: sialidase family protein, partial [Prosthecobacter sp.]|nr:sialidase family protein [Prosthecobacter sp.]
RGFVQLKSGRLLVGAGVAVPEREEAPKSGPDLGWNDTVVYYSDDGVIWEKSPDILQVELPGENGTRYGAIEPTLVELGDGRVWMLIRDRGGRLYESFSADGSRWSKAERTNFISSDSPAALLRLKDGRILIVWNPCQFWSDPRSYAMGGREVLHAAISADQGKTWSGFREILHETNQVTGGDRGTAYPSPTETADGKILVVSGQGEGKRAMVLFDPSWLMEKNVSDDVERGPVSWTQYGDEGLTAEHTPKTRGKCLVISMKSSGLCGAAWNFPGLTRGTLTFHLWVPTGAREIVLGLNDHFNRVDDVKAAEHLVFRADLNELARDSWQEVHLTWDTAEAEGQLTMAVNGRTVKTLNIQRPAACALNYLRLEARSDKNSGALKLVDVAVRE